MKPPILGSPSSIARKNKIGTPKNLYSDKTFHSNCGQKKQVPHSSNCVPLIYINDLTIMMTPFSKVLRKASGEISNLHFTIYCVDLNDPK